MAKINQNLLIGETGTTLYDFWYNLRQYTPNSKNINFPQTDKTTGFCPIILEYSSTSPITIDDSQRAYDNTRVMGFSIQSDGGLVCFQIGCITYSANQSLIGKLLYRHKHGTFGSSTWKSLN